MRTQLARELPYTPEQVFSLVSDIAKYPQFVPWVAGLRTWNGRTDADGVHWVDAEVQVGFAMLRERFSTRVRLDPGQLQIDADLLSGPFKHLKNRWIFEAVPGGTRVNFDIDFQFKSPVLDGLLSRNMDTAISRLIACFDDRARALFREPD